MFSQMIDLINSGCMTWFTKMSTVRHLLIFLFSSPVFTDNDNGIQSIVNNKKISTAVISKYYIVIKKKRFLYIFLYEIN